MPNPTFPSLAEPDLRQPQNRTGTDQNNPDALIIEASPWLSLPTRGQSRSKETLSVTLVLSQLAE